MMLFLILIASLFASVRNSDQVLFSGQVIDAKTKKLVSAQIICERLPYGSKLGVFSGNNFSFNIDDGHDYSLIVMAKGYTMHISKLKPAKDDKDAMQEVIELEPIRVNQLIRLQQMLFEQGQSTILPQSYNELDKLLIMLKMNETMVIQLEGHTDFRGNSEKNMKLSKERINVVRKYLLENGGDKKRIKTKPFGGTQPLSKQSSEKAKSANRRVEVRLLEI